MPCPVVSFGIVVYSGYSRKNRLLLALLTLWGLTGIKSLLFHVYEDLILLLCGLYGLCLLVREYRRTAAAAAGAPEKLTPGGNRIFSGFLPGIVVSCRLR